MDEAWARTLAYDPYGGRRKADWTAAVAAADPGGADARAHGPRASAPDGIHSSQRARVRPHAGAIPEPGPAGRECGPGAELERLQLRVEQPDELRRPERAVAGARGWGLRLGRRDVRRGRGRLRPGERGLHAPLLVRGHLHLLRFLLVQPAHRALDQLSRRGAASPTARGGSSMLPSPRTTLISTTGKPASA